MVDAVPGTRLLEAPTAAAAARTSRSAALLVRDPVVPSPRHPHAAPCEVRPSPPPVRRATGARQHRPGREGRAPNRPASLTRHGDRHRRPRRGRQVDRRPRRRASGSGSPISTRGRCTAPWRWPPAPRARTPAAVAERRGHRGRRAGAARRARRHGGDPHARGAPRAPRAWPPTPACAPRWCASSRRSSSDGDWVAEGRDIGSVVAPEAAVKVFLTAEPGGARAPPRRAELGADPERGAARAGRARRARRDRRAHRARAGAGRRPRGHHRPDASTRSSPDRDARRSRRGSCR